MLSKTLLFSLALSSVVSASPALRSRQADPCQDAYKSCIAAGTPEVACSCTLTACAGEDSARNREYCASATANLSKSSATSASSAPSSSSTPIGCVASYNKCRQPTNGVSANQSFCASQNAQCQGDCYAAYNKCRQPTNGVSANQAFCVSQYAGCLGENPVASSGGLKSTLIPYSATASSSAASTMTTSTMSTTYACNPAHSYPAGAVCTQVGGSLALVTPSPTAAASSSSAYQCNPAHSYPGGVRCDATARTLIYPSTSSAASAATTTAAAPKASGTNAAAPGSNPKKVDGKKWTLNNLNRYCGEDNKGCDYNFDIVADGKTQHCTVIRNPGSNAANESWNNQPCGDFKVSWGYVANPAPAYAVLTVVDSKDGELAWFGASNINGQAVTANNPYGSKQFGTVGPEQVYTYN